MTLMQAMQAANPAKLDDYLGVFVSNQLELDSEVDPENWDIEKDLDTPVPLDCVFV